MVRNMSTQSASAMAQQQRYQALRQDYTSLLSKISDIESERYEYTIVLETLGNSAPDRRCWRMIGGALIERTVGEVVPELEDGLRKMEMMVEMTTSTLKTKETEMKAIEDALGLRAKAEAARSGEVKSSGVLV